MFAEKLTNFDVLKFLVEDLNVKANRIEFLYNSKNVMQLRMLNKQIQFFYYDDFGCVFSEKLHSQNLKINATTDKLNKKWRKFMYKKFGQQYKLAYKNMSQELSK